MTGYSVILFFSNNHSIMASNVLKKNELNHKMVPVPRHLSSDCGYCIRISSNDSEIARGFLEKAGVEFEKIENI